jgi:TPR repeat protein
MAMATMFPLAVGPGTPHSEREKFKLLKVTAGRDHSRSTALSWLKLGRVHLEGKGTKVDPREALHCFEQASERGEPYGALEAGNLLLKGGPGFRVNRTKSQHLYQVAASSGGVPEAQRRLGELFLTGPPGPGHALALKYFLRAFEIDPIVNASAGMSAARMLQSGLGCEGEKPDNKQALSLLEDAASAGNLGAARIRLAVMYEVGTGGVKKDPLKARGYWKLAVMCDLAEAHYRCGVLTLNGAGFVKSEKAAVNGFRRACRLGFPLAAQRLAALRGPESVKEVAARRVKLKDFLDDHFQQAVLYPWPFYEDEVEQWQVEESEREEKEAANADAARKAKIKAMLSGSGRRQEDKDDEHHKKEEAAWVMPPVLRRQMEKERSELMGCLDAFEQHLPSHYPRAPPPRPDRVRDFFNATGLSGLKLSNVSVQDAVVALNGEGGEGPAFKRGMDGYVNAVEEQQKLSAQLGVQRRTAKPLSTRPKSKGHANLTGLEGKVYTAAASPDRRFVSAAATQQARLGEAKQRSLAAEATRAADVANIAHIARGGGGRATTAASLGGGSSSRRGGGGGGSRGGGSRSGTTHGSSSRRSGDNRRRSNDDDDPPSWMYDKVWMERPLTDPSLVRAVELRMNYGVRLRGGGTGGSRGGMSRGGQGQRASTGR